MKIKFNLTTQIANYTIALMQQNYSAVIATIGFTHQEVEKRKESYWLATYKIRRRWEAIVFFKAQFGTN